MRTTGMSSQTHKKKHSILNNNKGFTLIEIAIVLVIIGLILGSVLKGKDLINSSKQKKFYTTFLKTWQLSVASYYDRTGYMLGDGTINGGRAANPDGHFDNISGANFGQAGGVDAALKKVGLQVFKGNTANSGQYSFEGAYSGTSTITLSLQYLASHTDGNSANRLYLTGVPTDLAIALDKIVDGQMNSATGSFRQYRDDTSSTGAWPDASTTSTVSCSLLIDL